MITASEKKALVDRAVSAMERAYSPYSGFCVGAALLCTDGEVFEGINIENSSYGATVCAERTAFSSAVCAGKRDFAAIAIVGAPRGEKIVKNCYPCGICRQFMAEFCSADFEIIFYDGDMVTSRTLGELLPEAFLLDRE
jgi:cytidine deaminase